MNSNNTTVPKRNWIRTMLSLAGLALLGFGIHYIGSSLGFFLADKWAENSIEIIAEDEQDKEMVDVFWKSDHNSLRKVVGNGVELEEPYEGKGTNYFWVVYGSDTIHKFTDEKENEMDGRSYSITLKKKPNGDKQVDVQID